MNFAAIDFETANEQRCSACAVGIVVVRNSEIAEEYSHLIRPPELRFNRYNTAIHGIHPEDVREQPEFNDLWIEIRKYLHGQPLVAHNASFDLSVLTRTLLFYGIEHSDLTYACTRRIARAVWPGLPSYNLAAVAHHLGIGFQHHRALDDARACAEVVLQASESRGVQSLEELCALSENSPAAPSAGVCRRAIRECEEPLTVNPAHPFYGRYLAFTGGLTCMTRDEAMGSVAAVGGTSGDSVSKKTDYLVVGGLYSATFAEGYHTGKLKKALTLSSQGVPIDILTEDDFVRLLFG